MKRRKINAAVSYDGSRLGQCTHGSVQAAGVFVRPEPRLCVRVSEYLSVVGAFSRFLRLLPLTVLSAFFVHFLLFS